MTIKIGILWTCVLISEIFNPIQKEINLEKVNKKLDEKKQRKKKNKDKIKF